MLQDLSISHAMQIYFRLNIMRIKFIKFLKRCNEYVASFVATRNQEIIQRNGSRGDT